jgi:hypothetical protein
MSGITVIVNSGTSLYNLALSMQTKELSKYICIVSSPPQQDEIQIYDKIAISELLPNLKPVNSEDRYIDKKGITYKFFRPLYKLKDNVEIASSICNEDSKSSIRLYIPFTKPSQIKTFSLLLPLK